MPCGPIRTTRGLLFRLTASQLELQTKLNELRKKLEKRVEPSWFLKPFKRAETERVNGLYIYGGVGQGKTMLMDEFYRGLRVSKRRVHFHEFMVNVHKRLHARAGIEAVGSELGSECRVLCLDEFQVTHIADAMVLRGIFGAMFEVGTANPK